MNLQPVSHKSVDALVSWTEKTQIIGQKVELMCIVCGKLNAAYTMFADLDGKPFVDYYCPHCVTKMCGANNVDGMGP